MILNLKKFKSQKFIEYQAFFKKNGYLLIKNVFNKKDFFEIRKTLLKVSKKYTNSMIDYKTVEDISFHKQLIKLRKKKTKKICTFF